MRSGVHYSPEIDILEHEDSTAPETKRVLLYGWDADGLQKVRLKVNANGALESGGGQYKILMDSDTTPDVTYVGYADRGTATNGTTWEVLKIDK